MAGPSNETEVEAMERRKVEALERIAKAIDRLSWTVQERQAFIGETDDGKPIREVVSHYIDLGL
jgi:hypothetical protein